MPPRAPRSRRLPNRWRARAATSVAARERRERLAAEQAMAASAARAAARGTRGREYAVRATQRYEDDSGRAAAVLAPSTEYQGIYAGDDRSTRAGSQRLGYANHVAVDAGSAAGYYSPNLAVSAAMAAAAEAEVLNQERENGRVRQGSMDARAAESMRRAERPHADHAVATAATAADSLRQSRETRGNLSRFETERRELEWRMANAEGAATAATAEQG